VDEDWNILSRDVEMTDNTYIGILILLVILVFFVDVEFSEYTGKIRDKIVKHIKKIIKR
jgi:hypothetical protein